MSDTTHPADGIYYFTHSMLRKIGVCETFRSRAKHVFPQRRIVVTLEVARHAERSGLPLRALAGRMQWRAHIVTTTEQDIAWMGSDAAVGFMNMLLVRAKREGRAR